MVDRQVALIDKFIIDRADSIAEQMAMRGELSVIQGRLNTLGLTDSEPRNLTQNEFDKLQVYSRRLIAILERDGTINDFRGSTDYLLRSVIEALGIQRLFYDAPEEVEIDF